ncbi:uncharacterized protein PV09_02031 [Verruconis gallopava]|uniref:Domain of unknown function at the cortex 1 domain-containing protein n=1 Tax=Verruconis gallopava TaxID=253628 RepID=A0A0D1Z2I6_9PEZI|nr:uncharacterized protein PV09_02031 [Verruconis gallopava]KIW07162.1 hypothetical protein PV09_02031 [Verruconis gallopava]
MADPSLYQLKVTGGPDYKDQREIKVNTAESLNFSSQHLDVRVYVRVKEFRGLPKGSPSDCSYFKHPAHTNDRYSISFTFVPKSTINGDDLVFGNDFDHPIRDRLPPLFDKAFSIVKGWIDPGLYGDPYADEPYLYGPLLSSVNVLRIGQKTPSSNEKTPEVEAEEELEDSGPVIEEGADDEEGEDIRSKYGIPALNTARQKHFLNEENRKVFEFEQGRTYGCDFFNPYLDFNKFALRLPLGFTLSILGHWDGQPLRYVLRNRKTDEVLFVVNIALIPSENEVVVDDDDDQESEEVKATEAEDEDLD